MCLESSVLFSYFRCMMEFMWLEYRFLNACSVRPYVYVGFVGVVFWCDFCVVDYAGFLAVAFQGAVFLISAITTLCGIFCGFSCDGFVLGFDDACHVLHATVADLHIMFVEYFVKL